GVRRAVSDMMGMPDLPPVVASLARGFDALLVAHEGGDLAATSAVLEELAEEHARQGLTHYAGVGYHNAAQAAFARGQYDTSVTLAKRAIDQFNRTPSRLGIESTHALAALGLSELGRAARASQELESVG